MKKSTQVLMLTAGAIILAFVIMGLTVDINRFMRDLKPWVCLMFGTAFLCTTIAYGDIKNDRTPQQRRAIRLLMLAITVVCFILAAVSFINMH